MFIFELYLIVSVFSVWCTYVNAYILMFSDQPHEVGCFHNEYSAHVYCFTWFPWCRFYFDFSPTYVGCGLICPHIVNCSVLLGAIISWGFLWPLISQHAGDWYPADLGSNDFKGLYGYKVWCEKSVSQDPRRDFYFFYFCGLHLDACLEKKGLWVQSGGGCHRSGM